MARVGFSVSPRLRGSSASEGPRRLEDIYLQMVGASEAEGAME
ncbi:hypothetical protein [Candidatus Amarobacter glycogenicus]